MQQRINRMRKKGGYVNVVHLVAEWAKGVNFHTSDKERQQTK